MGLEFEKFGPSHQKIAFLTSGNLNKILTSSQRCTYLFQIVFL